MRIGAIIVTFNRLDALKGTLPRVLSENPDALWVIDNASTDGTGDWLAEQDDPRLHVIRLAQNTGGAGGFETGVRAALEAEAPCDWVVLFDDDAWPQPGCFAQFRSETWGEDIGAVSAAVTYPDGRLCEMNRQGVNPFWHLGVLATSLLPGRKGTRSRFKVTDTELTPDAPQRDSDNASFVGFFLRLSATQTAGLPEGGLFIYGDDVLYSLRLRRAGWRVVLAPALRFDHDCGTMGQGFVYRPLWKIYYHCRNGVTIARVAAGPLVYPLALTYYTLLWWRRGRGLSGDERRTYYRLMRMGLRDGLLGRRGRADQAHEIAAIAVTGRTG